MVELLNCGQEHYKILSDIWERSVRATHHFLTEEEIAEIKESLIPRYFPDVRLYAAVDDGHFTGFVGLSGETIEMLFVDGDLIGRGYGSLLIEFAVGEGARRVDVNEQNPTALAFYRRKGFDVVSRDEYDDAGRPFPILHLLLLKQPCGQVFTQPSQPSN